MFKKGGQDRARKTVDDLIYLFDPVIAQQFKDDQWQEVRRILDLAIDKPSPKIIDLRFTVDLIVSRFYFTLFVGKDRRHQSRNETIGSRVGNFIAVVCLLLVLNLLVSSSVVIVTYLIKSAMGIDLMPNSHFSNLLFD